MKFFQRVGMGFSHNFFFHVIRKFGNLTEYNVSLPDAVSVALKKL